MKAMILAAGKGERLRPLTQHTHKPLVRAAGVPLIEYHVRALAAAGFQELVINHAWLGHEIERALGEGSAFGVRIRYSRESTALETAGGIANALPLLGNAPFLVMNGDVWCDWNPAAAPALADSLPDGGAWMLMVDNPVQHPNGDFHLASDGRLLAQGEPRLTYSGIAVYHPSLFATVPQGAAMPMLPLFRQAMADGLARGARHTGRWTDVGTPQRLADLDAELRETAR